jgi:hypothetical protein
MPRIPGTTNEQSAFLRAFHRGRTGPPPRQWPTPPVLRRWLAKPAFRAALLEIHHAMQWQRQFHLTAAAVDAAYGMIDRAPPSPCPASPSRRQPRRVNPLRLIERHLRDRS